MYTSFGESCARHLGKAAVFAWACCVLSCIGTSVSYASFFHSSNEPSVDIRVVDKAGPIWVSDKFVAEDQFGLPSLQIYETFKGDGENGRFWADVKVKVSVRHPVDHHDPWWSDWGWGGWGNNDSGGSGWGSGGSGWGDWGSGWGNNDNGDSGCDSGGWGSWGNSSCDTSESGNDDSGWGGWGDWGWDGWDGWDWGHDDPPTDPNFSPESLIIGIDKFVKNKTSVPWFDFRIQLGTGLGDDFEPSNPQDGLYIVHDPEPKEVTSFYGDLSPGEEPENSTESEVDSLQWFADPPSNPGQGPWDKSIFWFGVHIPEDMFYHDSHDPELWHAKFTIRQHTGIPEPTTCILLLTGSISALLRRKKFES